MSSDDIPTVGEWYHHLPRWQKFTADLLMRIPFGTWALLNIWYGYSKTHGGAEMNTTTTQGKDKHEEESSMETNTTTREMEAGRSFPSYEESVQRYYGRVLGYILKWTKNPQIAEDLTQTTFLRAWQAWPRLRPNSQIQNWLITIASNTIRSYVTHIQRKPWHSLEEILEQPEATLQIQTDVNVEESYLQQETTQEIQYEVREALKRLPKQFHAPLLLSAEGYACREIASQTGTPLGTVLTRIHRGRIALTKELQARR